jgi:hypothetical protein
MKTHSPEILASGSLDPGFPVLLRIEELAHKTTRLLTLATTTANAAHGHGFARP